MKNEKYKNDTIYFSREIVPNKPSRVVGEVINLLLRHKMAIQFYMDKDFTIPVN